MSKFSLPVLTTPSSSIPNAPISDHLLGGTQDSQDDQGEKLSAIAEIISASGGFLGNLGGFFGHGSDTTNTSPQTGQNTTPPSTPEEDEKKKKNRQLIYIGVGILVLFIVVIIFKKKGK